MRLIDADALCEGRVSNDPVVIAAKCAPTIEAEPVQHGEWLVTSWRARCSLCGFAGSIYDQPVNPFKYFPHCGAIMDGGVENG